MELDRLTLPRDRDGHCTAQGQALRKKVLASLVALFPSPAKSKIKILLALSGGKDSMALLDLLISLKELLERQEGKLPGLAGTMSFDLLVVHVDHRLHPQSSLMATKLANFVASRGGCCSHPVLFFLECLDESLGDAEKFSSEGGVEAWARGKRYERLKKIAQREEVDLVATAHHQGDAIETFWMRLLEGKEFDRCAHFCAQQFLGASRLWRPLLGVEASVLGRYVEEQRLPFFEDPTNGDLSLRRNLVRQKVLPLLEELWPGSLHKASCSLLEQSRDLHHYFLERIWSLGEVRRFWWGDLLVFPWDSLTALEVTFILKEYSAQFLGEGLRRCVVEEILRQKEGQDHGSWWRVDGGGGRAWQGACNKKFFASSRAQEFWLLRSSYGEEGVARSLEEGGLLEQSKGKSRERSRELYPLFVLDLRARPSSSLRAQVTSKAEHLLESLQGKEGKERHVASMFLQELLLVCKSDREVESDDSVEEALEGVREAQVGGEARWRKGLDQACSSCKVPPSLRSFLRDFS